MQKLLQNYQKKKNSNFSKINVNTRSSSYIINKMKSKTIRKQMSNLSHDNMYSEFILFLFKYLNSYIILLLKY